MQPSTTRAPIAPADSRPQVRILPDDATAGTLVGRAWVGGPVPGPAIVAIRDDGVFDLSSTYPTMSTLLDTERPAEAVRSAGGQRVCSVDELLTNSLPGSRDETRPWLLAPCDLQAVKAAGVTFAASMVERMIEEQAHGDAGRAQALRAQVTELVGDRLHEIRPGSDQAMALKALLQRKGLWSQYLEVGIGPDAEVFTKAPVLASVGCGDDIGILAQSTWNNPEPEVVLAVNSRGDIVGATLGNDINLRDIEGRSALLLPKAKDNNASSAIGPFIRLFDDGFGLDDVRNETVHLHVAGTDGFEMRGVNTMSSISRDPTELVGQTIAAHQYPDGFMLFLGTLFAPIDDRDEPGGGFTHKLGDIVTIQSARLGTLQNCVTHCETAAPWKFGVRALVNNLSRRGLLSGHAI